MLQQLLSLHGGGSLELVGDPLQRRWVLLLCRDNFRRDDALAACLTRAFQARGQTVGRYENRATETRRRIDPPWRHRLPVPVRVGLKGLHLLTLPTRWAHFLPSHRRRAESMPHRTRSLRELLRHIGPDHEIHLVTRSASGRVASLIADEGGIASIVCLGYPFEHPDHGPEPARYAHLATLRTPMLILQGTRDVYGGRETDGRYPLSPAVRLEWIETNHDFDLPEAAWPPLIDRITDFLRGPA